MIADTIEIPGFAEPVGDAQTTFRAVLDAMARPGRIHTVGAGLRPPAPMDPATAAVSLTLIDQETTLHLDPVMRTASAWLAFHAGARFVSDRGAADFVIASCCPLLSDLRRGTDEAPERSATLILQIAALGTGAAYRLSGPGLAEPIVFRATGMPDDFVTAWQANHALFPRGIDIILCAGHSVAALPRSIVLEAA